MTILKGGFFYAKREELWLDNVLQVGQSFRWVFDEISNEYVSTMKILDKYHIVQLKQVELEADEKLEDSGGNTKVEFRTIGDTCDSDILQRHLYDYFRMETSVSDLYSKYWLPNDARFSQHSPSGNRMLAQEPWETLISFICSSNNNISRITKMCHDLCKNFGSELNDRSKHYSFPTSDELIEKATEEKLRELGFGYRAKYIIETAKLLIQQKTKSGFKDDTKYLMSLKDRYSYIELREHLMGYNGVGPKVADCVCLMGFRHDDVVPVDVHIARIAKRDYKFQVNKTKIEAVRNLYANYPITRKKINIELDLIRDMFVNKWGNYAGWAQGILFSNEVGKSSGATSNGDVKKRPLNLKFEVKEESKIEHKRKRGKN